MWHQVPRAPLNVALTLSSLLAVQSLRFHQSEVNERDAVCQVPNWVGDLAASVEFLHFGVPKELFHDFDVAHKKIILSKLIPGNTSTYQFFSEQAYYQQYSESFFGATKKKGGWDCLRHYEIMVNGAVPIFENLAAKPDCVAPIPRRLLQRGQSLFDEVSGTSGLHNFVDTQENNVIHSQTLSVQWMTAYKQLQQEMLSYAKEHFTTEAMAKQWAKIAGVHIGSKVLLLNSLWNTEKTVSTPFSKSDYMRDLLFHGLRTSGYFVVDYPRIDYMYKDFESVDGENLYGNGYTYSRRLHNENADIIAARQTWKDTLVKSGFDHVIFASAAGHFVYPTEVFGPDDSSEESHTMIDTRLAETGFENDSTKVSMVFGDDPPIQNWYQDKFPTFLRKAHIFVREGFVDS